MGTTVRGIPDYEPLPPHSHIRGYPFNKLYDLYMKISFLNILSTFMVCCGLKINELAFLNFKRTLQERQLDEIIEGNMVVDGQGDEDEAIEVDLLEDFVEVDDD